MKLKKLFSFLLAVCLILPFLPAPVRAEELTSGTCGDNLTWVLDEQGTLTISGTGPMWDYADYWAQIPYEEEWGIRYEYVYVELPDPGWNKTDVIRVVIEEGVTNVGSGAFARCTRLESVSLSSTVTEIRDEAFRRCSSLTRFHIPETVTTLGSYALADTGITSLTIPGSIKQVPESLMYSIYNDSHLQELVIEEGVESVGTYAFRNCTELTSVVIPDSLCSFGYEAFYGCTKLKENYESLRQELTLGQPLSDKIEIPGLYSRYYTFTAAQSREYSFTTLGYADTQGTLFDENMNELAQDTDSGDGSSFFITQFLEAGQKCILKVDLFTYGGTLATESNGAYEVLVDSGHTYHPTVIREPDCEGDGILRYTCDCCGDSYTETVPGGHRYENGICTRCGNPESYILTAANALSGETGLSPVRSSNKDDHFYDNYCATPINSQLQATENGFLRAEHIRGIIYVEEYDREFRLVSKQEIPLELSLYGGIYLGQNHNYVVCGQNNPQEDNDREVFRVIRYSKDWVREDSASICGANTTIPFRAASLRFAEYEDMLYIRTGHQMYTANDGLNHQANVTLGVRISDMEVTIQHTAVSGSNFGYTSHSFDQFITVDGDDLLALDLGDAYPRSVVLYTAIDAAGQYDFRYASASSVSVMDLAQTATYQYTGVSLGGLTFSDSHYLVAGNAVDHSGETANSNGQRNIFVSAIPKADLSDSAVATCQITNHTSGVRLSPPHLVKVDNDRFFLTWTENGAMRYCFLDGSGRRSSEIFSAEGQLSDCVPVYSSGALTWYVTNGGVPTFYQLELYHVHRFGAWTVSREAGCAEPGERVRTCSACGHTEQEALPALGHEYTDGVCSRCGEAEEGEAPSHIPGDITGDGEVNNKDLTRLFRYLSGFQVEVNEAALDITGDGAVNNKDLTRLFRYLSGFDVEIF